MMNADFWQQASFRGAAFFVNGYDNGGGRRGPDHEFPNKDEGYPEDTGKKIEAYSIAGYVVRSVRDPDYAARRDSLKKALNQRGPGELVHPAFGTIMVQVRAWSISEEKDRLGLVPISMDFVEASTPAYPSAQRPASFGMDSCATKTHQAAASRFSENFSAAGKSDYLRDCSSEDAECVGAAYSRLSSSCGVPVASKSMQAVLSNLIQTARTEDDVFAIADAVAAFPMAVTAWHEAPWAHRKNSDGTYRGMADFAGGGPLATTAVTSLFRIYGFTLPDSGKTAKTATRRHRIENANALTALTRTTALIESARVAPFVNWATIQEAEAARDRIAYALDMEAETAADDDLFSALLEMRLLVLRSVPPERGQLPSLMRHTPRMTMPSLVLSFKLYGDTGRADEVVRMNGLRHPGFVPGMEPIQVLSNVG